MRSNDIILLEGPAEYHLDKNRMLCSKALQTPPSPNQNGTTAEVSLCLDTSAMRTERKLSKLMHDPRSCHHRSSACGSLPSNHSSPPDLFPCRSALSQESGCERSKTHARSCKMSLGRLAIQRKENQGSVNAKIGINSKIVFQSIRTGRNRVVTYAGIEPAIS